MNLEIYPYQQAFNAALRSDQRSEIAHFRGLVTDQIRNGNSLWTPQYIPNGDDMIAHWSEWVVLSRLCAEEGISSGGIKLRSYPVSGPTPDGFNLRDQYLNLYGNWDNLPKSPYNFYERLLATLGCCLGIQIDPRIFQHTPLPVTMNGGALSAFDPDKVTTLGTDFAQQALKDHDRIVVIAQAGSESTKRFSDQQVLSLIDLVRNGLPNAFIAVASDKVFVRKSIAEAESGARSSFLPVNDTQFKRESYRDSYDTVADCVVDASDINKLGAAFRKSQLILTTDSFWSWFGFGCRAMEPDRNGYLQQTDGVVLYPRADLDCWGIPGVTLVDTPAVAHHRQGRPSSLISAVEYRQYHERASHKSVDDMSLPGYPKIRSRDFGIFMSVVEDMVRRVAFF